uniref:TIMP metallopeptidase inhibitor 2 n=1 Tax=Anas platyrhynchos TaxID=8839 RepID=A0A8B9R081_ANAPL
MPAALPGLLAWLAVLLLARAPPADGCSCSPIHPQQAFCNADVVIRAKAVSAKEVDSGNDIYGNPIKRIQYEVKQIKMFKGPDKDIEFIYTAPVHSGVRPAAGHGREEGVPHRRQVRGQRQDAHHAVRPGGHLGLAEPDPEEEPQPAVPDGLRVQDLALPLHPVLRLLLGRVSLDRLGDGEDRGRAAGEALRLHQEERRLVRLVPRHGPPQARVSRHRGPLSQTSAFQ